MGFHYCFTPMALLYGQFKQSHLHPTLLFTGSNSLHTYAYLFSTVNVTYAAYSFYTGITVVKCMDGHDGSFFSL